MDLTEEELKATRKNRKENKIFYVLVDIGCIECGEDTNVLGIFTDMERAIKVMDDHDKRQKENWTGQHSFEIFERDELNKEYKVNY